MGARVRRRNIPSREHCSCSRISEFPVVLRHERTLGLPLEQGIPRSESIAPFTALPAQIGGFRHQSPSGELTPISAASLQGCTQEVRPLLTSDASHTVIGIPGEYSVRTGCPTHTPLHI